MKIKSYYLLLSLALIIASCNNPKKDYLWHVKSVTYQSADSSSKKYVFTSTRKDSAVKYLLSLKKPENKNYTFSAVGYIIISYDNGDPDLKIETNGRMLGPIHSKFYITRNNSHISAAMDSIAAGKSVGIK